MICKECNFFFLFSFIKFLCTIFVYITDSEQQLEFYIILKGEVIYNVMERDE